MTAGKPLIKCVARVKDIQGQLCAASHGIKDQGRPGWCWRGCQQTMTP